MTGKHLIIDGPTPFIGKHIAPGRADGHGGNDGRSRNGVHNRHQGIEGTRPDDSLVEYAQSDIHMRASLGIHIVFEIENGENGCDQKQPDADRGDDDDDLRPERQKAPTTPLGEAGEESRHAKKLPGHGLGKLRLRLAFAGTADSCRLTFCAARPVCYLHRTYP